MASEKSGGSGGPPDPAESGSGGDWSSDLLPETPAPQPQQLSRIPPELVRTVPNNPRPQTVEPQAPPVDMRALLLEGRGVSVANPTPAQRQRPIEGTAILNRPGRGAPLDAYGEEVTGEISIVPVDEELLETIDRAP